VNGPGEFKNMDICRPKLLSRKEIEDKLDDLGFVTDKQITEMPWYLKDNMGWPIERFKNKPIKSFVRIVLQNIRKITG
jgi:hypothetical protein